MYLKLYVCAGDFLFLRLMTRGLVKRLIICFLPIKAQSNIKKNLFFYFPRLSFKFNLLLIFNEDKKTESLCKCQKVNTHVFTPSQENIKSYDTIKHISFNHSNCVKFHCTRACQRVERFYESRHTITKCNSVCKIIIDLKLLKGVILFIVTSPRCNNISYICITLRK